MNYGPRPSAARRPRPHRGGHQPSPVWAGYAAHLLTMSGRSSKMRSGQVSRRNLPPREDQGNSSAFSDEDKHQREWSKHGDL
jgi:hypothetical protein